MSIVALFGALETGLLYALMGLGVYLSFQVLEFPDLTVDGSFPLGGAVVATVLQCVAINLDRAYKNCFEAGGRLLILPIARVPIRNS